MEFVAEGSQGGEFALFLAAHYSGVLHEVEGLFAVVPREDYREGEDQQPAEGAQQVSAAEHYDSGDNAAEGVGYEQQGAEVYRAPELLILYCQLIDQGGDEEYQQRVAEGEECQAGPQASQASATAGRLWCGEPRGGVR